MNRIFFILPTICIMFVLLQSCNKQTTSEALDFPDLHPKVGSPEYYEALRNYKKSDHAIAFGWWGYSDAPAGITADMSTRYIGLPDSMDIISLWGGIPKDPDVQKEMQLVRNLKGTKFVLCLFGSGVEKLIIKNDSLLFRVKKDTMAAIDNVAKAIADTVDKYQIDGFDLDYEPSYGDNSIFGDNIRGTVTNDPHTQRLFKSLSQYMGPQSGTEKILVIDGQFDIGIEPYVNYLIQQAYGSGTASALQGRFTTYGAGILPPKKFVVTEEMQKYGSRGVSFMYNGVDIGSLLGMAYWNPTQGRKGGFGAYIIETDYKTKIDGGISYYYMRQGIQIQNPAPR
ncbi:MAG: glycoside hydrolase family 18 [Niabella sp.]